MAIAFDSSSKIATQASVNVGNPLTWSHTCTGSQLVLFVDILLSAGAGATITGITYNGVAMTLITSTAFAPKVYSYYLVNPSTGANTVSASFDSPDSYPIGFAKSYTGVAQTGTIDSFNSTRLNSITTVAPTTIVVASNCWLLGIGSDTGPNTSSSSITSNQTDRQTVNSNPNITMDGCSSDSNGTVATGSQSVTYTFSGPSFNNNMTGIIYSIAPYIAATGSSKFFMFM